MPNREVLALVRTHHLYARGIGWVDMHLLASALADGFFLWTADPRMHAVAEELGIAHSYK
jgi:hypothetical protein